MEADVEITLIYDSVEEASAISKSVSPDNLTCPEGLTVDTRHVDKKVITVIKYCGENMATLLSTIDDLLSCIATAEKTIIAVRNRDKDI
ncbi:MAG: KEOPS complex subunit Pcc1 [Candidatus Bathyarchaeia archaeon]